MATYHFNGHGAAGNWADPLNWGASGQQLSAATEIVATDSNLSMYGTATLGNVMILGSTNAIFYGALTATASGSCVGFMVCDDAVTTFAPGSSLYLPNGALEVGYEDVGTFIAQGTAANPTLIHSNNATIGRTSVAFGTLTFDHATWINDNNLFLGFTGTGVLNVQNGSQVSIGRNLAMGFTAGASGTLTLSSGSDLTVGMSAVLAGGGMNSSTGYASVTVNAGSVFDVRQIVHMYTGSTLALNGGTVSVGGCLQVDAGAKIVGNGTINTPAVQGFGIAGTLEAHGGTLNVDSILSKGSVLIDAGSTINVTGATLAASSISFAGAGGTLEFAAGTYVNASVSGFVAGDQIDVTGIDSVAYNTTTHNLTLSSNGHVQETLHMVGTYGAHDFSVTQVNGIGDITLHS